MKINHLLDNAKFIKKNSQNLDDISVQYKDFFINKNINNLDKTNLNITNINNTINILNKEGILIIKNTNLHDNINNINTDFKNSSKYIDKLLQNKNINLDLSINDIESGISIEGRSNNRYEIKCPLREPYINYNIINNIVIKKILIGILQSLRIEIDTLSIIRSYNNLEPQHWHADTTTIFQSFQQNNKILIPPAGIVMIIPLNDIPTTLGPTEFLPRSHNWNVIRNKNLNIDNEILLLNFPDTVQYHCAPELNKGDIILFDIRLYHRGGNNKTDIYRDIMYISYFSEWYYDRVNFQEKNTNHFDKIPEKEKLLLSRIDSKNYTNILEHILIKNNININTYISKNNIQRKKLKHIDE